MKIFLFFEIWEYEQRRSTIDTHIVHSLILELQFLYHRPLSLGSFRKPNLSSLLLWQSYRPDDSSLECEVSIKVFIFEVTAFEVLLFVKHNTRFLNSKLAFRSFLHLREKNVFWTTCSLSQNNFNWNSLQDL